MTLRIIICHLCLLILAGDTVRSVQWTRKGEAGESDLLTFGSVLQCSLAYIASVINSRLMSDAEQINSFFNLVYFAHK